MAVAGRLCNVGRNILKRQKPRQYPQRKIDLGQEIVRVVESQPQLLILHYNALDAQEWSDFRYDMKQENVTVKVYPNKLTCKFLSDTIYRNLCTLFRTDTALAFGEDLNLKNVLKVLGNNPKIELIGAKIDDILMNRQQVLDYSKLPNLDQTRGELIQILSQPGQRLSQLLQTNQSVLSLSLQQYLEQHDEEPMK